MDRRTNEQTDGPMKVPNVLKDFVPFGAAAQKADSRPERADSRPERAGFRPKRTWGGRRTEKRTNERTNERKSPVFYRTSSPVGPLPCFPSLQFTIMQSRVTGIADHILPWGDLLFSYLFEVDCQFYFPHCHSLSKHSETGQKEQKHSFFFKLYCSIFDIYDPKLRAN